MAKEEDVTSKTAAEGGANTDRGKIKTNKRELVVVFPRFTRLLGVVLPVAVPGPSWFVLLVVGCCARCSID